VNLENCIEAVLFVAESPVTRQDLIQVFGREEFIDLETTPEKIDSALLALESKYNSPEFSFSLRTIADGYQFLTKPEYANCVKEALLEKEKKKLSKAALETLAIIAYRQPVSKSELEHIRGVNCDYAVQKLLERNLIAISGRSDSPGKPLLYATSAYFMEYFGIGSLNDLPKLQEITSDEAAFQEEFKIRFGETDSPILPEETTDQPDQQN